MELSLKEIRIISAINYIFGGDEQLLQTFYSDSPPYLSSSKSNLLDIALEMGKSEQVIFKVAMNLLELEIDPKLSELINLDRSHFINLLNGLIHLKEINLSELC